MKPDKAQIVLAVCRLQGARDALATLTKSGTAEQVGRRTLLLTYLLDASIIGNQRALAKRLGVTPGRACQMLHAIRRYFR